ncbi:MAG: glycoside hydrolase [Victivallales bacterium]|jgi:hypothetical protein|nr:glycoside hydrolase [Victivallales bacterium]
MSGGYSEGGFEFMPDGSMVMFLRSTHASMIGIEWGPMYYSRSEDAGITWTKPVKFSEIGVSPKLCRLDCGAVLLYFGRPGAYLCATTDPSGKKWEAPITLLKPKGRQHLANVKIDMPTFFEWEGICYNDCLLATGFDTALIFYSDFYYPDNDGVKRKTVLCREIRCTI